MTKQKKSGKNNNYQNSRDLQFKEDGQVYGQALKMLGNGRLDVQCFDGIKRLAHIRGSLKGARIETNDILLLALRDFQDSKCDVIIRYTPEETRLLRNNNQIPQEIKGDNKEIQNIEEDSGGFTFEDI